MRVDASVSPDVVLRSRVERRWTEQGYGGRGKGKERRERGEVGDVRSSR